MSIIKVPYNPEMNLGSGMDPARNTVMRSPFLPTSITQKDDPESARGSGRFREVFYNSEQYQTVVKTAASVSGSGFGWSASATVNHLKEACAGSASIVAADYVHVETSAVSIADTERLQLRPDAIELLGNAPDNFLEQYGTHYVVGFIIGGSFVSTLTLRTQSSSEAEKLGVEVSGKYADAVSAGGKAEFETYVSSKKSSFHHQASSRVLGDSPTPYTLGNLGSMLTAADSFAADLRAKNGGARIKAILQTWDMLECVKAATKGRQLPLEPREDVLQQLTSTMLRLEYLVSTVVDFSSKAKFPGQTGSINDQLVRLRNEQNKIRNLSVTKLAEMTYADAIALVDFETLEKRMTALQNGEATVVVEVEILPGWRWVSMDANMRQISPERNRFRAEIQVLPGAVPQCPAKAVVENVAWGFFRFEYNSSGDQGYSLLPSVEAEGKWGHVGERVGPGKTSEIDVPMGLKMSVRFK